MLRVEASVPHCNTPERPEQDLTIRQGCLTVNPTTPHGRRLYVGQMLILCFVPVVALVVQNLTIMAQYSTSLDASMYLNSQVDEILTLGEAVLAVQDERYAAARRLVASPSVPDDGNKERLFDTFSSADAFFEKMPPSLLTEDHRITLYHLREGAASDTQRSAWESYKRLAVYESIISSLLQFLERQVKTISALWRQLSACLELLIAREKLSLAHLDFHYLSTLAAPDPHIVGQFLRRQDAGLERLQALMISLKDDSADLDQVQHVIE